MADEEINKQGTITILRCSNCNLFFNTYTPGIKICPKCIRILLGSNKEDCIGIKEACKILGDVSPQTVYNYIKRRLLKAHRPKIEGNYKFLPEELEECLIKLNQKPGKDGARPEHERLKQTAKEFLLGLECKEVKFEVPIRQSKKIVLRVDVMCLDKDRKIAIECGGSSKSKLNRLLKYANRVYVLPYGQKTPYLWESQIKVCESCGNKI